MCPRAIMKWKWLFCILLAALLLGIAGMALAEEDPIVCSIEFRPERLPGPGTVTVTISVSNSGDTDMKDPLLLLNPASQQIADFGEDGSVTLKSGDTKTWTGTWDVNDQMLNQGVIAFYAKYTLYDDSGNGFSQTQPIQGKLSRQTAGADVEITRTISPTAARDGQVVTVKYDIANTGTELLKNITIQENDDINKNPQKVPELKSGDIAQVKFDVTMGKKDLTSSATVTFQPETSGKTETRTIDSATIVYGEPAMGAKLTAGARGVVINDKVTLTLDLVNSGTVDYTDLRVNDSSLGEVFSNQSLPKDGTLKLEKEITLTQTTDFQFIITAIDNTGTEVSLSTDPVTVIAMEPGDAFSLNLVLTSDRTEVYDRPGVVRFSLEVTNDSPLEVKNVNILHGATPIYTFTSIPSGESRRLTRDAALSMPGKYQFTASAVDLLGETVTFQSNEIQVAFADPTPAPATPTPRREPTPEPVFVAVTMPPGNDPSIGTVPRTVQSFLLPVLIACGLLLCGTGGLLIVATKRRADQRKASEAAYDHLERYRRRDYVTPAETAEEPTERASGKEGQHSGGQLAEEDGEESKIARSRADVSLDDVELPHLKYVRDAYVRNEETKQRQEHESTRGSIYDDDLYETDDVFPNKGQEMDEEAYDDPYPSEPCGDRDRESLEEASADGPHEGEYAGEFNDPNRDPYGSYEDGYDDRIEDDGFMPDDRVASPDAGEVPEPGQNGSTLKEHENPHSARGTERTRRRARENGTRS